MELTLVGLLHDIGKLWRRAGRIDDATGPNAHARGTAAFFAAHGDALPPLRDAGRDSAPYLAAQHHAPQSRLQHLIAEANCLATALPAPADAPDAQARIAASSARLRPGLELLGRGGTARQRLPLAAFSLDLDLMSAQPAEGLLPPEGGDLSERYETLLDGFIEELRTLPRGALAPFVDALTEVWDRWTRSIPASPGRAPQTSLAAHGRATAAIAGALYAELTAHGAGSADTVSEDRVLDRSAARYQLFALRLVGAPAYVAAASDRAARRGRAVELELLLESATAALLSRVGLSRCNALTADGATRRFFLPHAATPVTQTFVAELEATLLARYGGAVGLASGQAALSGAALQRDGGAEAFATLERALRHSELRPYAGLLAHDAARLFTPAPLPSREAATESALGEAASQATQLCAIPGGEADLSFGAPLELAWSFSTEPNTPAAGWRLDRRGPLPEDGALRSWPWRATHEASGSDDAGDAWLAVQLCLDGRPVAAHAQGGPLDAAMTLAEQLESWWRMLGLRLDLPECYWTDQSGMILGAEPNALVDALERLEDGLWRITVGNSHLALRAGLTLPRSDAATFDRCLEALGQARRDRSAGTQVGVALGDDTRVLAADALGRLARVAEAIAQSESARRGLAQLRRALRQGRRLRRLPGSLRHALSHSAPLEALRDSLEQALGALEATRPEAAAPLLDELELLLGLCPPPGRGDHGEDSPAAQVTA